MSTNMTGAPDAPSMADTLLSTAISSWRCMMMLRLLTACKKKRHCAMAIWVVFRRFYYALIMLGHNGYVHVQRAGRQSRPVPIDRLLAKIAKLDNRTVNPRVVWLLLFDDRIVYSDKPNAAGQFEPFPLVDMFFQGMAKASCSPYSNGDAARRLFRGLHN